MRGNANLEGEVYEGIDRRRLDDGEFGRRVVERGGVASRRGGLSHHPATEGGESATRRILSLRDGRGRGLSSRVRDSIGDNARRHGSDARGVGERHR